MGVFLVRYELVVPVVARDPEHARRVAEAHLLEEAAADQPEIEELMFVEEIPPGFEDVVPWGDDSDVPLVERLQRIRSAGETHPGG